MKGRCAPDTSILNRMMCQRKKSTIPKDPIQLNIGLSGPPKKAASRLKNSHSLDMPVIVSSVYGDYAGV
jgi:hypothetical protein